MSQVQWQELPPLSGPQSPLAVYMERLRLLVDHPGEWALIRAGTPSAMHQAAGQLRRRQYHIPPGLWSFAVRSFRRGVHVGDTSTANLYARFDGKPDDWVERWKRSKTQRSRPTNCDFNDEGKRVCPDCGSSLTARHGHWPWRCDECWAKKDPKWFRRRERLRKEREGG